MATLAEIRTKYPQYDDMSDGELADAFYSKFYADMNRNEFNAAIGYKPSKVEDVAKSGAAGAARGSADLLGLPGTIADAMREGGEFILRKGYRMATGAEPSPDGGAVERFFAGPQPEIEAQLIGGGGNPLSGASLNRALSSATGGATERRPQTTEGEFARTFGEFAPAAAAGPGGLLRKAAMATVPAVASETAGQATKGSAAEPWARAAAALGTGVGVAGVRSPVKMAGKGAPSAQTVKANTDKLYQAMRDVGIKYDSNAFGRTVQDMSDTLLKEGFRPSVAKEAFAFVDDLYKQAGHSLDFDDINGLVQRVGGAARDAQAQGNGTLASAFGIIRDKLDDFERSAPLMTSQPVSRATLDTVRSTARKFALRNIKQRTLDEILKDADVYAAGKDAGIRQGLRNLLKSAKGKQLFKGAERQALLNIANGRKALNTLSKFGFDLTKTGGNSAFLPAIASGGTMLAGFPGAGAALAVGGTAAKAVGPRLTERALDTAAGAIRSGKLSGPLGSQVSNQLIDQNVRRFLATQNALGAARTPSR